MSVFALFSGEVSDGSAWLTGQWAVVSGVDYDTVYDFRPAFDDNDAVHAVSENNPAIISRHASYYEAADAMVRLETP